MEGTGSTAESGGEGHDDGGDGADSGDVADSGDGADGGIRGACGGVAEIPAPAPAPTPPPFPAPAPALVYAAGPSSIPAPTAGVADRTTRSHLELEGREGTAMPVWPPASAAGIAPLLRDLGARAKKKKK